MVPHWVTHGIRDHVRDPGSRIASRMELRAPRTTHMLPRWIAHGFRDDVRCPGSHVEHHNTALDPSRNSGSRTSSWIPRCTPNPVRGPSPTLNPACGSGFRTWSRITLWGYRTEFRISSDNWPRIESRLESRSPQETPDHSSKENTRR